MMMQQFKIIVSMMVSRSYHEAQPFNGDQTFGHAHSIQTQVNGLCLHRNFAELHYQINKEMIVENPSQARAFDTYSIIQLPAIYQDLLRICFCGRVYHNQQWQIWSWYSSSLLYYYTIFMSHTLMTLLALDPGSESVESEACPLTTGVASEFTISSWMERRGSTDAANTSSISGEFLCSNSAESTKNA